jgi:hypothetical protein
MRVVNVFGLSCGGQYRAEGTNYRVDFARTQPADDGPPSKPEFGGFVWSTGVEFTHFLWITRSGLIVWATATSLNLFFDRYWIGKGLDR